MNFNQYSKIQKKRIDSYLHVYMSKIKNTSTNKLLFSTSVLDQIDEFVVRGKSIRGILTLLSAELFGYKDKNTALIGASALEMIHSSLLIHDDIMDNDLLRRGKPSVFSQYALLAKQHKINSPYFSKSMGISVGNCALLLGIQLLNKLKNYELTNYILQEIFATNIAQMQDVFFGEKKDCPTEKEIEEIYLYKTARYTFSLPLITGATLAGVNDHTKQKLGLLGEYIGILFQLQDDNIGLYSNVVQSGKQVGSDVVNNKKTLLRILLEQRLSDNEKRELNTIYGNNNITEKHIALIRKLNDKYHINQKIEEKKEELKILAGNIVTDLTIIDSYKKILSELIEYISSRLG